MFHWIADHERLFGRLFAALRPGGRLVAQCGGAGNVERFHRAAAAAAAEPPYAEHLDGWRGPWNFAGAEETAELLRGVGFEAVETWLEDAPVRPPDPAHYLRTVCLGHHLERLPEELQPGYVEAVLERSDAELDYVRLNMQARRP